MKNNNNLNSIIIAVISGIVVCLVCVGVLFLTSSSEKNNLKENNNSQIENNEDINLGDCTLSCVDVGGTYYNQQCWSNPTSGIGVTDCQATGHAFINGMCYMSSVSATRVCDGVCCCNGGENDTRTSCGWYAGQSQCFSPRPYEFPGYTADNCSSLINHTEITTTQCWQLSSNNKSCSQITVNGSTCSGYYSSESDCRSHIVQDETCWCKSDYSECKLSTSQPSGYTRNFPEITGQSACQAKIKTCDDPDMRTEEKCERKANNDNDCSYGYTGCDSKDSNGCYSYTCKPAPSPSPKTCPNGYVSEEKCHQMEGQNITCVEDSDGCWNRKAQEGQDGISNLRVNFYDSTGSSIIATCYTYNGKLTGDCNPCCTKYDVEPGYNQPTLDKSYIIGERTFTKSTSYYCAVGYDELCNSPTPTPNKYSFCCRKTDGSKYNWQVDQSEKKCPPGYEIDETKNQNLCQTVTTPACYKDSDNNYYWTDNPVSSWIKVDGITKEKNCKEEEEPACYKDSKGEYKWGKYATNDGYTLITSIKDEDSCKNPTNEACYKNDKNDYVWAESAPEGYTKVDGVGKPEDCGPEENPACYLHGKEFVWGKYSNVNGYIFIENITDEKKCKPPIDEACYKDPDGDYVWGEYSDDEGFTLVPNITEMSQCGVDVPTPKTGIDVQKIIYIFMAVLMAFGIGFIYYSANIKKYNQ